MTRASRFGIVEKHQFATIPVPDGKGGQAALGFDQSTKLWEHLQQTGYVDARGKVQDKLRTAIKAGTVDLPAAFQLHAAAITEVLRKLAASWISRTPTNAKRSGRAKQSSRAKNSAPCGIGSRPGRRIG